MENEVKQGNDRNWVLILAVIIVILFFIGIGLLALFLLRGSQEPEPAAVPTTPVLTQAAPTAPVPTMVQDASAAQVVIQSYIVEPQRILAGGCANISWVVQNADLVQLKQDGLLVLDQAPAIHTYQTCPSAAGSFVYRLEVSNAASSSNWMELQVIADQPVQAAGSQPATPAPPDTGSVAPLPLATGPVTVNNFYIEPQRTNVGGCAIIYWEVLNADQIQLLRDGVAVVPNAQLRGSFEDCYNAAAIYKYRLEAKNSEGSYNVLELQEIVE